MCVCAFVCRIRLGSGAWIFNSAISMEFLLYELRFYCLKEEKKTSSNANVYYFVVVGIMKNYCKRFVIHWRIKSVACVRPFIVCWFCVCYCIFFWMHMNSINELVCASHQIKCIYIYSPFSDFDCTLCAKCQTEWSKVYDLSLMWHNKIDYKRIDLISWHK